MDNDDDDDVRLSTHIRHLLLGYVRSHLTTDYIQFTQNAVAELVILNEVPSEDPTSLFLPTDPFTTLTNILGLQFLQPYDEKLRITKEVQTFIKEMLGSKPGKIKSEHVPDDFDDDDVVACKLMSPPVLSRRAVRETPVLGTSAPIRNAKKTLPEFTKAWPKLGPVDVEEIQEPKVNMNQVLDLTFQLRAIDHTAVRTLLKSVSTMCRQPAAPHKKPHPYLPNNFFETSSTKLDPINLLPGSPLFTPIFPRRVPMATPQRRVSRHGGGIGDAVESKLESVADLPAFIGAGPTNVFDPRNDDLDPEGKRLYEENMVVVDGWQTFATSSPSILSSDDDEVDQLLLASSPNTELSPAKWVKEAEDSKLEEIQMPRARRIGGPAGLDKCMGVKIGKVLEVGLGAFLGPLLTRPSADADDAQTIADELNPAKPGEGDNVSTHGQPPSAYGANDLRNDAFVNDAEHEIRAIYTIAEEEAEALVEQHPNDLIRDELLFDEEERKGQSQDKRTKDEGMAVRLMPVPILPAPNSYVVRNATRFRNLKDYKFDASKGMDGKSSPLQFLKTVKGMASLRVSLSWVPFNVTSPTELPNNAQLLEIDSLPSDSADELQTGIGDVQILLQRSFAVKSDVEGCGGVVERLWEVPDDRVREGEGEGDENGDFSPEIAKCEIILTRGERRALARGVGVTADQVYALVPEEDGLRRNNGEITCLEKKTHLPDDNSQGDVAERPAKRARLAREGVDDSGIELISDNASVGSKDYDGDECQTQDDGVLDFEDDTEGDAGGRHVQDPGNINILAGVNDHGHQSMLTYSNRDFGSGYSYNRDYEYDPDNDLPDADKENCSPLVCVTEMNSGLERDIHETCYRYSPDFNGGDGRAGGTRLEYNDVDGLGAEEGYTGGSFEPLPLSFDSQAYHAANQPHTRSQNQSWDDQGSYSVNEDDWHFRAGFVQDSRDINIPQENMHFRDDRSANRGIGLEDAEFLPADVNTKDNDVGIGATAYMNMDLATRSLGIDTFVRLRAKAVKPSTDDTLLPSPQPLPSSATTASGLEQEAQPSELRSAPQNLYDRKTLCLPSPWILPTDIHKYMASLDLLQKQVLVRSLRTGQYLVHLVERHSLEGVDLILDPYTAVIFAPLLSLPSEGASLLTRVSTQSHTYKHLLVVFEAYPVSRSFKPFSRFSDPAAYDLHAYTPPIMKAIKRFRRDLDIGEACGTKAATCEVKVAFADSVDEAAAYARCFGEIAKGRDETRGAIWGQREWLDLDISEHEADLASIRGMNHFSASIVLSQVTAQQYLDMTLEDRIQSFAPYIGVEAINACNLAFAQRLHDMQCSDVDDMDSIIAPIYQYE